MKLRLSGMLPVMLVLAACGSDSSGGESSAVVQMIKWTPSGDNQTDTTGQTLPLVLRVKVTSDGAVSAGHEVVWTGPGSFGSPTSITGANGIATTTWTLPTEAGVTHATATLDGAVGSPLTFTATGSVGAPTAMYLYGGDNQSTVRGEIFNGSFTVQITDTYGNGKEGVYVHWQVTGPATVLVDSSPSDVTGFANGYLTAKDELGAVTLTASVAGLVGSPQIFHGSVVGETSTVNVVNNAFQPANLAITAGGAVEWVLVGSGHTVTATSAGPIPDSGVLTTNQTWGPVLFTDAGVYTYECSEHVGMTGQITVNP